MTLMKTQQMSPTEDLYVYTTPSYTESSGAIAILVNPAHAGTRLLYVNVRKHAAGQHMKALEDVSPGYVVRHQEQLYWPTPSSCSDESAEQISHEKMHALVEYIRLQKRTDKVRSRRKGLQQIRELASHRSQWAGRDVTPPSTEAVDLARQIYLELDTEGLLPNRIIASGEGGIAFCFMRGDGYADIELLNSGECLATIEDRTSDHLEVWEFDAEDVADTIDRIEDFLASWKKFPSTTHPNTSTYESAMKM